MAYSDFFSQNEPELVFSDRESDALGVRIFRFASNNWSTDKSSFLRELQTVDADCIIVRTKNEQPDLKELADWSVIHAGELVYWSSEVNPQISEMREGFHYEPASNFLQDFQFVVESSFSNYSNHYSYNPMFSDLRPEDAYVDWALRRAKSNTLNDLAGVLFDGDVAVGAISGTQCNADVEIELAGIAAESQGKGMYGQLISGFWKSVSQPEQSRIVISTQKENESVQKAWVKLDFHYEFSVFTTHLVRKSHIASNG